ncbi:MAG: 50S ribosomal protein L32 [Dehalococcoidales bacterium]
MALPKRKYAKARQGKRRNHLGITPPALVNCPQCNSPRQPHHACLTCGSYDGKEVIEIKAPKSTAS